ncbi:hypothetical protein DB30_04883 [Enhygromyxa salina]|uniref:DUF2330 domain-containing protein n=1 Tax=Enhygromyxa salina TaxID=215803 RepID=A0A0C2D344_9BACT|nr:hypothetical protein DB30_04883 [Enhygromyxa salina]
MGLLGAPRSAQACGGTFCDNLPDPMPVDQRGEDILFIMDGSTIEVQVRIEYTGEAERFAWVLPIQALPEVTVGSDPLFTAMSNALAPSWQVQTQYDCDEDDPWAGEGGEDSGGSEPKFDAGGDPGPDVVLEAVVGAFEVVVLQGGTAQEVIDFLNDNDYAQDPNAAPILQSYLDEGFLFAAVKLAAGADVQAIHPLSFKFQGTEPCVPIRLTRIAAKDDMGIRAYFLGQDRWAPSNYDHVVLNPLAYNWKQSSPAGYVGLLSMAVDEAGGHAFATEYAGSPNKVETFNIYRPTWDETAFVGVDPIAAIDIIADQALNIHPLIQALLLEFIPPPDGVDATEFWNNIDFYADQINLMAWDDLAFSAGVLERIIEPGLHAVDLLDTWPKLTRLNTTISPSEMTLDPTFHANADLPDVTSTIVTTTEQVLCGGDSVFRVAVEKDQMPVCVPEGASYPGWEQMPNALRVEKVPQMGPPQVESDNAAAIAAAYESYQSSVQCLADGGETGGSGTGTSGGDGDGDGGGGSGAADDGDGTETGPGYNLPYDVSCGCSSQDGRAPIGLALGLLVLGLIGPWRRQGARG